MFSKNSKWIGCDRNFSPPIVIKRFNVKELQKAIIDITGLGYYELFVNGDRVSDEYFKPVVSDYSERDFSNFLYPLSDRTSHTIYYNTYDIAKYLETTASVRLCVQDVGETEPHDVTFERNK